jgi:hypothetical protein
MAKARFSVRLLDNHSKPELYGIILNNPRLGVDIRKHFVILPDLGSYPELFPYKTPSWDLRQNHST